MPSALPTGACRPTSTACSSTLGGWAHVARYELWQAELAGKSDETITDFLTIRLLLGAGPAYPLRRRRSARAGWRQLRAA
jgi:uncharacterized protein YbcC (UPF0753/DUF2309 family)